MHKKVFLIALLLLFVLPAADLCGHFLPRTQLAGVPNTYRKAEFTKRNFISEKFQRYFERWARQGSATWGWSVRAYNELLTDLFGQVSNDYRTSVQLARENYFFQPMYLRGFNKTKRPPNAAIEQKFKKVSELSQLLAARGVPLVVLISPNLIALYPELLPDRYADPTRINRISSYDVGKKAWKRYHTPIVDSFAMLQARLPYTPYRFIEKTGSHWNQIGACLAVRAVVEKLNSISSHQFRNPMCDTVVPAYPPHDADVDLVKIANLLFPGRFYQASPLVVGPPDKADRKRFLLVGSSFLFGFEQQLLAQKIADQTQLFFYYREKRSNGDSRTKTLLKRDSLDWEKTLSADAIILEVNETGPGQVGFGFVEDALKYLKR